MITIFNINEFVFPYFLILALFRRNPVILSVQPIFPPFRWFLDASTNWAISKGYARWIIDLCPDQRDLWEYPPRMFFHDVFGKTEKWHNTKYGIEDVDKIIPDYSMAYKHTTCNHAQPLHLNTLLLGAALEQNKSLDIRISGLPEDSVELFWAYWGKCFDNSIKNSVKKVQTLGTNKQGFYKALKKLMGWI